MFESVWKKTLRRKRLSLWSLAALVFRLMSLVYASVAAVHRWWPRDRVKVSVPVISVGNISVGGTGKTPTVWFLADHLIREGYRVGVVSSGWGRESDSSFVEPGYRVLEMNYRETGDETKFLAVRQPEIVFSVDQSKTAAAIRLAESGLVDVLIVDDGFQHYRLHRDMDIITYDAALKKRVLQMFPYGVLREPLSSLKRADVIVVTRANFARNISMLRMKLSRINPGAELYHAQFTIRQLVGRERRWPVKYLSDKSVFLFAGVGNFKPLRQQVDALAGDLDYALELSDHQVYTPSLLEHIKNLANQHASDILVTTGKDWVKLGDFDFGRETYYLEQTVDLDPGEEKLIEYICDILKLKKREG